MQTTKKLALLEESEWCDIHGNPIHRRSSRKRNVDPYNNKYGDKHNNNDNTNMPRRTAGARLASISYLLLRFGILASAIFYCVGAQFLTLRRLTVEIEIQETNDSVEPQQPPIIITARDTSLLGRIQAESKITSAASMGTPTTKEKTATHTRRVGASAAIAAASKLHELQALARRGSEASTSTTETETASAAIASASKLHEMQTLARRSSEASTSTTITTETKTVTRTRTVGAAAASAQSENKNPKMAWPILASSEKPTSERDLMIARAANLRQSIVQQQDETN